MRWWRGHVKFLQRHNVAKMNWWRQRLNRAQRRGIVLALALEVVIILGYGVFSLASVKPSDPTPATGQAVASPCENAAHAPNPIVAENSCAGTISWQRDLPIGNQHDIEAFTAPVSVNAGESVKLYVSTAAPLYQFRVYRMGWYQGLGGRLMYSSSRIPGIQQPAAITDPSTRMISARNWHDPVTVPVPTNWVSGVYLVKLESSAGYMRYTFFVVRNDASHAQILFQSSVLTDQAYNLWGGRSLYQDASGSPAQRSYAVSFDRPYTSDAGLSNFGMYEYDLLRWLEKQGYDVTYSTDVDTDSRPSLLLNHRLFLAAGHDEYWSTAMRKNVTRARDAGVSLAFFGANDIYWHVRLQSSSLGADRVVVCYKDATLDPMAEQDPTEVTVRWRDPPLNQPEDAVLGAMYSGLTTQAAALVIADGATSFLNGTALHVGSTLPGLVAQDQHTSEVDSVTGDGDTPSTLKILASSPALVSPVEAGSNALATVRAASTLYTARSGARVFDAGTYWWSLGLDNFRLDASAPSGSYRSDGFERFTVNLLGYLLDVSGR